jgi:hypothetical protein
MTIPRWLSRAFRQRLWWLDEMSIESVGIASQPYYRVSGQYMGHVLRCEDISCAAVVRDMRRFAKQIDREWNAAYAG